MSSRIGGQIARDKSNLTASDRELWRQINAARGERAQKEPEDDSFLGIDTFIQKMRGQGAVAKSKWKSRFARAMLRRSRLKRLRASRGKSKKIFSGSLQASLVYGACTLGVSDTEFLSLRRVGCTVFPANVVGRSLSVALGVFSDPAWRLAVAPLPRWGKEVYFAANVCGKGVLPTEFLRKCWLQAAATRSPKLKWRSVKNPLDAVHVSLGRIGWRALSPFEFETDKGCRIDLQDTPPKFLQLIAKQAVQREHERAAAKSVYAKRAKTDDGEKRLCFDHIVATMRASKLHLGALSALCAATGGLWTASRFEEEGYVVPEVLLSCKLCGEKGDSLHHRLWKCRCTAEDRDKIFRRQPLELRRGRDSAPDDPLTTRASAFHPMTGQTAAKDGNVVREFYDNGVPVPPGEPKQASQIGGGYGYLDGSCDTELVTEARRAGWAAVFTTKQGTPTA